MAISIVGTPVSAAQTATSSLTYQITVPDGATLLCVGCTVWGNGTLYTVTSITANSVELSLKRARTGSGTDRGELWYLVRPSSGTYNIVVTFSGTASEVASGAICFSGTDTSTDPFTASNDDAGTGTNPSVTVTSADGDVVVDTLMYYATPVAPTSPQVERWDTDTGTQDDNAGSTKAGASPSVTMSWTTQGNTYVLIAASIKPEVKQIAYPISDVTKNSWFPITGSNLYEMLDPRYSPDTSYFIYSDSLYSEDYCEVLLSGMSTPITASGHTINYIYSASGLGTIDLKLSLYQGAAPIFETTASGISTAWVSGLINVPYENASNITDYSDLRIRFTKIPRI